MCATLAQLGTDRTGKPGLCISYPDLIRLAFRRQFWNRSNRHLNGAAAVCTGTENGFPSLGLRSVRRVLPHRRQRCRQPGQPRPVHPDGGELQPLLRARGAGVRVAADPRPHARRPVLRREPVRRARRRRAGRPGSPVPDARSAICSTTGSSNGTTGANVTLIPDNPTTPFYDGFGPDELFGFDIFAGANLTAALAPAQAVDPRSGSNRNPPITNSLGQTIRVGSNPVHPQRQVHALPPGPRADRPQHQHRARRAEERRGVRVPHAADCPRPDDARHVRRRRCFRRPSPPARPGPWSG